ncbi:M48 family metalloprotease [Natronolimnohabitans sp. A-GB9]|uniref:M48 family metallopeptidase n=1 Tax=Natronolimnohabitans sp. A-GB9 TaxID=3069757 RepID=UPI0027B205FA|nr:M48 family metalloprotease [Natronolimnohabitans sp. A-GB9]MDQ2051641.1 M48 family metalloprotease [Natronolimnohabitans sp. A-GB9]
MTNQRHSLRRSTTELTPWIVLSVAVFLGCTLYLRWAVPTADLSTVAIFLAVVSILASALVHFVVYSAQHVLAEVQRILDEESSRTDAITRIAVIGFSLLVSLVAGGLLIFGESLLELVVAVFLLAGMVAMSGTFIRNHVATRPLNRRERAACEIGSDQDIAFRVVTGQFGQTINGIAAGVFPAYKVILINEHSFEALDTKYIAMIAAHELGHVDENHAVISLVGTVVLTALSVLSLRYFVQYHWMLFLVTGSAVLVGRVVFAWTRRQLEYRADRYAAKLLEDPHQVANGLRALRDTRMAETADEQSPGRLYERAIRRIQHCWTRILSTHPPIDDRIAQIERLSRNAD